MPSSRANLGEAPDKVRNLLLFEILQAAIHHVGFDRPEHCDIPARTLTLITSRPTATLPIRRQCRARETHDTLTVAKAHTMFARACAPLLARLPTR